MPWIYLTIISVVLDLIYLIKDLITFTFFKAALIEIPSFALVVYLFVVVWSYRFSDL